MELLTIEALTALATLSAMEIVLGIDNIIFISIIVARLPDEKREFTRKLGIFLALLMRILLLLSITWIMSLTKPIGELFGFPISGRNIILFAGGLFLIAKSTFEVHHKFDELNKSNQVPGPKFNSQFAILQVVLLDIVFSLDSVITAVGMAKSIWIMISAMTIAMLVMLIFAKAIGDFVEQNPTIKILALSFLILIGVMLIAEGMGQHIDKGYIYFAMAFALGVEIINMRYQKKLRPKQIS